MKPRVHILPLLLAAAPAAAAQGRPVVVARVGDVLPAGDAITQALFPRVADSGDWALYVKTDHADPDRRNVLLRNGNVVVRSGNPAPGGGRWLSIRGHELDEDGDGLIHAALENVPGYGATCDGLFFEGQPFLYEGDVTDAAGFGAGSTYSDFKAVNMNDARQVLLRCNVLDTNLGLSVGALIRIDLDASGSIVAETVLIKEPQIPFGQSHSIVDFPGTTLGQAALNDGAGGVWSAKLDAAAAPADDVCYYNTTTLIAQSSTPSVVVPGRDWGDIGSPFMDSNASPSWVAKLFLDASDTTNDRLILQDGNIFAREGSPIPGHPGTTILDLGAMGVWLTDSDEVVYYVLWDGAPATSEAILVGDTIMLRRNVTTTSTGEVVDGFMSVTEGFVPSNSGDRLIAQVFLDNGDTAVLIAQRNVGTPYCSAEPNSTGAPAITTAVGSSHVDFNALRLETTGLPTGEFGYYLASLTPGDVLYPGGSAGRLCLGGTIGRFNSQVKNSGLAGEIAIWVDLTSIPVNPPVAVQAGDTWHFQAWNRDGMTSNFSQPVAITFD